MKRFLCLILALLAVIPFAACSADPPPALEDVKERVIELIENSYKINEIYYGEGLPVYKYGSDEANKLGLYFDGADVYYERVKYDAEYYSIDKIKADTEKVYAKSFIEETNLYTTMFVGYVEEGVSGINYARYIEDGAFLCQYRYADDAYNFTKGVKRIYDYDTMVMEKQSTSDCIYIRMNTHKEGETETLEVTLRFVYEYGKWYLASMTY